jgi:peptidoglycan hydrolase CwlO-like protein
MRKHILALVVVAAVLALNGAVYAEDGQTSVKVINTESLNKFRQNTTDLREQLKAKDLELRRLNGDETIDVRRADELEADIRGIKEKLKSVAASMNLEVCNCLKM